MSEPSWTNRRCSHGDVETRSAASARKLVSALWQHGKGGSAFEEEEEEAVVGVCDAEVAGPLPPPETPSPPA